ncbi:hypothetical protein [Pseudonocardia sp. DLS-67]
MPFLVIGALSAWAAGRAPSGRRSPEFDWTLTWDTALQALSKRPHIVNMLLLFLLAVTAVGVARCRWAATMTFGIGLLWELVQTTAVGQHPRLADLLPDLLGIGIGWFLVRAAVALVTRLRRPAPSSDEPTEVIGPLRFRPDGRERPPTRVSPGRGPLPRAVAGEGFEPS